MTSLQPRLSAKRREALSILRAAIRSGAVDKQQLMLDLFVEPDAHGHAQGCGCNPCKTRLRLNAQRSEPEDDLVSEIVAAVQEELGNVVQLHDQRDEDDDPAVKVMTAYAALYPGPLPPAQRLHANARGGDNDRRLMVYDLVSDPNSPYTPDDLESLRSMSFATLVGQHQRYVVHANLGGGFHAHAADDPAIAAMTAHVQVRQDLLLTHARKIPTVRDLLDKNASPLTPDDERIAEGAEDEEVARAMTAHEGLMDQLVPPNKRSRARAA